MSAVLKVKKKYPVIQRAKCPKCGIMRSYEHLKGAYYRCMGCGKDERFFIWRENGTIK